MMLLKFTKSLMTPSLPLKQRLGMPVLFHIFKTADLEKNFFCELWNFGNAHLAEKMRKLRQILNRCKLCKSICILNAFFFFLLTGATWYYHTIYLVFTYCALYTDYQDDIFEVISNLHVHGSKFGGKINKFGGKSFRKLNLTEFMEFFF